MVRTKKRARVTADTSRSHAAEGITAPASSERNTQPQEPAPYDLSDDGIQSLVREVKESSNTLQASNLSDSLRKILPDHPKYKVWENLLVKGEKASARYRSSYARQRHAAIPDPQTALGLAIEAFEHNRDAQISLVKDYQSAETCERALKGLMDFCLDWFQRWLVETRQDEAVARGFTTKLRLELLERLNNAKLRALETAEQLLAGKETQVNEGRRILKAAMESQGLNGPELARKARAVLKKQKIGQTKKVDRSSIYRIVDRTTMNPDPQLKAAIVDILGLSPEQTQAVFPRKH
jgi:hypothetical protein